MPANARNLIDRAYSRSTYNDPEVLATDGELIARIDHQQREIFSLVNKQATPADAFFGKKEVVNPTQVDSEWGWSKPSDLDVLLAVEAGTGGASANLTDGDTVHVVPQNDRTGEVAPRVYPLGSRYLTVGEAADPAAATDGDDLRFIYARFPSALDEALPADNVANELDADFPTAYERLFVVDLAMYLSTKDARFAVDGEALSSEEAELMAGLLDHVLRQNRAMRSRFGQRSRVELLQQGQG